MLKSKVRVVESVSGGYGFVKVFFPYRLETKPYQYPDGTWLNPTPQLLQNIIWIRCPLQSIR